MIALVALAPLHSVLGPLSRWLAFQACGNVLLPLEPWQLQTSCYLDRLPAGWLLSALSTSFPSLLTSFDRRYCPSGWKAFRKALALRFVALRD